MNDFTRKTVVVPWDFSDRSRSALKVSLEMVDTPDKIEVIHVTPYPAMNQYELIWGVMPEANIEEKLEKLFEQEREQRGLPQLKLTTVFGDPGSSIAEFAKGKEAGLIVISSHGHTGVSRLLLGSVAERVVRLAPCPVLVLRGQELE